MRYTTIAALLLASTALAWSQGHEPFVPVNPADTSPASALDDLPNKTINNGIVSAKVYLPDEFGFYRSTRFDHAGMITHITYKGHDYGKYWFVKTSPDVQNFTYDKDGLVADIRPMWRRVRSRNSARTASTWRDPVDFASSRSAWAS